ncbi:MAG: hypothetical protein AAF399_15680 [Bacteroidota bacterium]
MNAPYSRLSLLFSTALLLVIACQPDVSPPPPNPYDAIEYEQELVPPTPPDSATIVGLHTYIFSVSCAVPGCHDGSFEPDFRTVQSTYSTLVYHPVVKNDNSQSYAYRVIPEDVAGSWLYNRVTTEDPILGRMPLYDNPLTDGQLKSLREWINAGAPDMFGQAGALPNTQPVFRGVAAFQDFGSVEIRVDTFRENQAYHPFGARANLPTTLWFWINDDSTALEDLQNVRVQFASGVHNLTNFQSSLEVSANYASTPLVIPDYQGSGESRAFHWYAEVNTSAFPVNEFTLFRFLANDGAHAEDFEFPRDEHPIEFMSYMAMYVVP